MWLETAWHGQDAIQPFHYDTMRANLINALNLLNNNAILSEQPKHLIVNSIPGLLYMHILQTEKSLQQSIASITALAPALNIPGAISTWIDKKIPWSIASLIKTLLNTQGWKILFNPIRQTLHKQYNVSLSYLLSLQKKFTYQENIDCITKLNNNIPLHMVYNIGDTTVQWPDNDISDVFKKNNISLTTKIILRESRDRHRIYPDNDISLSTVPWVWEGTIANSIKQFIDQHTSWLQ